MEVHSVRIATVTPSRSRRLKEPRKDISGRGSTPEVRSLVETVIADVRLRGDAAVREYSDRFDHHAPESFMLTDGQLDELIARVPKQVMDDIAFVQQQVRSFAENSLPLSPISRWKL